MDNSEVTIEKSELASGVRLDVPFFGQNSEDVPKEWQDRVCGIVALRMAFGYVLRGSDIPTVADLISESEAIKGWTPYGLNHDAVVRIAHNHGVAAYREEFRAVAVDPATHEFGDSPYTERMAAYGKQKLREALDHNSVPIVSFFVEGRNTHLVPLVGYSPEGWYYHDPDPIGSAGFGPGIFISNEDFDRRFRKLVIFIGPKA